MNIGQMDRRVGLEFYSETRSPLSGEVRQTWQSIGQVWAKISYGTGSEAVAAEQVQAVQLVTFRIRYHPGGLTTRYRVTHEGQVYDILSVAEVGRRVALDLKAETRS